MHQGLSAEEFAAKMYTANRLELDMKMYKTPEEKAEIERECEDWEAYYLQVQDQNILHEVLTPISTNGGLPPPPVI